MGSGPGQRVQAGRTLRGATAGGSDCQSQVGGVGAGLECIFGRRLGKPAENKSTCKECDTGKPWPRGRRGPSFPLGSLICMQVCTVHEKRPLRDMSCSPQPSLVAAPRSWGGTGVCGQAAGFRVGRSGTNTSKQQHADRDSQRKEKRGFRGWSTDAERG